MSDVDQRREAYATRLKSVRPTLLSEPLTEADVRAKLVDPLFIDALGWPERLVRRERSTSAGDFVDYLFGQAHPYYLVAEAKRATQPYVFPKATVRKTHQISALVSRDKRLLEDIRQVAAYCQDEAVPYAVLTNGQQLVAFKALREDRPWMKGEAVIFDSPDDLLARFSELWELLSFPAVRSGSLSKAFAIPDETPRHHESVLACLQNPDEVLLRNHLNNDLLTILRSVFEDLTEDPSNDILSRCYVYSAKLQAAADDFIISINDLPPRHLRGQVQQISASPESAEPFASAIAELATSRSKGRVSLLLGGIGAGKTTFLNQMRAKYCREIIDEKGAYYYLDFRDAPPEPPFEAFVYSSLRRQLSVDPIFAAVCKSTTSWDGVGAPTESPVVLSSLFRDELARVKALADIVGAGDAAQIAEKKWARFNELAQNDAEVVARALRSVEASERFILLAFDNADQLDLPHQLVIFLLAQNIAAETGANILVALREEKFYLASQQGAFSAFHTNKFHIPSPRLTDLLAQRLRYATDRLDDLLVTRDQHRIAEVSDFIAAIWHGGVGAYGRKGSSNVVRLLERTCHGNMRLALRMFRAFMQSGNTNTGKIVRIYRENLGRQPVPYYVPFHEFTKSVMLGDYRWYRESRSDVLNLFAVSGCGINSHLTSIRILRRLMELSERNSVQGAGYVEVSELLGLFAAVFPEVADARFHLDRLLRYSLVDSESGVVDFDKCNAVRASAAGEYYLTYLAQAFAYLDLVWVDTPLADTATLQRLRELASSHDIEDRFERVDLFLRYLESEEKREAATYPALARVGGWDYPIVAMIEKQVESEKRVIRTRMASYGRPDQQ